jgi:hypothetical protein
MARLDVERIDAGGGEDRGRAGTVVLTSPPNWTAALFFACLSALHLFIVVTSFLHHRWEAYMSVIFGVFFAGVTIVCRMVHTEVAVQGPARRVRVRTGTRRIYFQRSIPFGRIRSVRLTLLHPKSPQSATIELVCDHEVVECPPTRIPREEALCLAVTMGVRLIKVYGEAYGAVGERLDSMLSQPPSQ